LLDCTGSALTQRTFDGTCNNLIHPEWGSTNVALLRTSAAAYSDGISAPVVGNPVRPSPREISNRIVAEVDEIFDSRFMAAMIYAFGQFIDHDLSLTKSASPPEPFDIPVPMCDPFFDPGCTGTQVIHLNRSRVVPGTGTDESNPRQQPNQITAYIDGSAIYGSDAELANKLRTHMNGKLKTSPGGLLPLNNSRYFDDCDVGVACVPMDNDAHKVPDTKLFVAGDVRANENIELTSLHTLFVREHNFWSREIKQQNPSFTDEEIYQLARHIVAAELQAITYNEWIPTVFGPNALPTYTGYVDTINAGVATEFSTASFRMGHSMLGNDVQFLDNLGQEVADEIPLSDAFFNPTLVAAIGIGPILKYLASDPARQVDTVIVDGVRNFLFGPPGAGGFDLASLNMQRGRDHGLADYNTIRVAYGLAPVTTFAEITSDPTLQFQLQQLYGNVDNIDPWIGGLAEDRIPGTSTGELLREVILDQFQRARDGDRFWYQRTFSGPLLDLIEATTLKTIIVRNTEINNLQHNAFLHQLSIQGTVFHDVDADGVWDDGEPGLFGNNVKLIDAETGSTLKRKRTDPDGNFQFNNLSDGLHFGSFQVRVVVKPGWTQTTPNPPDIEFTAGSEVIVTFGLTGGRDAFAGTALRPSAPAAHAPAAAIVTSSTMPKPRHADVDNKEPAPQDTSRRERVWLAPERRFSVFPAENYWADVLNPTEFT
jgi:hypothetical protein